jgi:hypothetical protein
VDCAIYTTLPLSYTTPLLMDLPSLRICTHLKRHQSCLVHQLLYPSEKFKVGEVVANTLPPFLPRQSNENPYPSLVLEVGSFQTIFDMLGIRNRMLSYYTVSETAKTGHCCSKVETTLNQTSQICNLDTHHLYHHEQSPLLNPPLPPSFRLDMVVRSRSLSLLSCWDGRK